MRSFPASILIETEQVSEILICNSTLLLWMIIKKILEHYDLPFFYFHLQEVAGPGYMPPICTVCIGLPITAEQ
jgi:hypothetical protein